ncbi:MAG: cellulase family glycosylhydrolase [Phycisphaerales bacterium]|nr:MAG: cellulase family glycosylhydrolase [Phycisphaerales bacterium]
MRARRVFEICLCLLLGSIALRPRVVWAAENFLRESQRFVKVSARDGRYFELTNSRPFVPIGLNMIAPYGNNEQEALQRMEQWIDNLSENRGNYIRLWLSHNFFDIEHERSGQYDPDKAKRIDAVLEMARTHNVRVKMTIEHFRHFFRDTQSWAAKPLHHVSRGGPAADIDDFFQGRKSRDEFKKKLAWYADRYGSDPVIFAWELWNEMDTVRGKGYMEWTEEMLAELRRLFPKNLVTQSLGSFDDDSKRERYRRLSLMTDNDFANVHRYLDLGASLDVCKGPVDIMAADAIRELKNFKSAKPILLAESGAVEPSHTGPFKLYQKDKAGIILHDVIFAPFFAGAAGTGQTWHWDHYVAANNVWFQFDRFAEAVKEIDPSAEHFEATMIDHPRLRIYALEGKHTLLAWCRDRQNTWRTELAEGTPPSSVTSVVVSLPGMTNQLNQSTVSFYNPWLNQWSKGQAEGNSIALPAFTRSVVIKMRY